MKVCDVCMQKGDLKDVECQLIVGSDVTRIRSTEVCPTCIGKLRWSFDGGIKKMAEFKQVEERYYDRLWSKK